MEFKGTKGKWKIIKRNEPYHNGLDIENVCMLYQLPDDNESEDIYNANALLISKAPEMLEMLIELKDTLADGRTFGYNDYDRLEELIKQATEI